MKRMTALNLHAAPPAYHGAIDYAELERLGLDPAQIIDFSVNSNPYGPSARVRQAIAATPPDRYPDRESLALRRALADQLDVPMAKIMMGNGAAEILWLIAMAFIRPGDRVLIIEPTFGEYARLAAMFGAEVLRWRTGPETGFQPDCEAITGHLTEVRPRLMFLCNPNNPTGVTLPVEQIALWADTQPETLFVIDEAYLAFAPPARTALAIKGNNLLLVRSMTKDYALAGLRLGYAVSHNQALIEPLTMARPAWNVNALAQAAGLAALADEEHRQRSLEKLIDARQALCDNLNILGLAPVPSSTHYFLVSLNDAPAFRLKLLRQGLLVRNCTSFGLPDYIRIATRRPPENDRLVRAIKTLRA